MTLVFILFAVISLPGVKKLLPSVTSFFNATVSEDRLEQNNMLEGKQGGSEEEILSAEVEKIINLMSPEKMAGQLMMVGFSGLEPDYYISCMINLSYIGGVVLFSRNIEDSVQVAKLNNQLQKMSIANKCLPLFIAVDQEGGKINRFRDIIPMFPGPAQLGKLNSPDAVELVATDTATELGAMGVNVNFAPVLDVGYRNSVMAGRVFSSDPTVVAELGVAAVNGYRKGGVIPCVKHFPGLGRSINDTHKGPVEINVEYSKLYEKDILPFYQAIKENVEMVMVSHALYPALDRENPSSLSYGVQTSLLRETLGYNGLIISDDLEMGAATAQDSIGRLAVKAIKAGTDIVLVCHTPEKQKEVYEAILAATQSGEISDRRLNESLRRIITLKLKWKIDQRSQVALSEVLSSVNSPVHRQDARELNERIRLVE